MLKVKQQQTVQSSYQQTTLLQLSALGQMEQVFQPTKPRNAPALGAEWRQTCPFPETSFAVELKSATKSANQLVRQGVLAFGKMENSMV